IVPLSRRACGGKFAPLSGRENSCHLLNLLETPWQAYVSLSARLLRSGLCGYARLTVNQPIDRGVAQDDLHVFARLREWNGFDEFGNLFVISLAFPRSDTVFARVVSGGRVLGSAHLAHQIGNVNHAYGKVEVRLEKFILGVTDLHLLGKKLSGLWQNLHQANGVLVRN